MSHAGPSSPPGKAHGHAAQVRGADAPVLSDRQAPRLGPRRQTVLQHLREAIGPLGVDEMAALTALHPNTARFHLDGLTADGLVARTAEPSTSRGRPRILYGLLGVAQDQRSYAVLAEMLAGWAAASDGVHETALATGRAWGRRHVEGLSLHTPLDADRAIDELGSVFRDIGFQPEISKGQQATTLTLHHCPFQEVAARYPEVVCGIHLGIMQGALDALGGAVIPDSLTPFTQVDPCVAQVHRAGTS